MKHEALEECARYILHFEETDFKMNPSKNHVYYKAVLGLYGQEHADLVLKEAQEDVP